MLQVGASPGARKYDIGMLFAVCSVEETPVVKRC